METKKKAFKVSKIFIQFYLKYHLSFEVQSPGSEFGQKPDPQHSYRGGGGLCGRDTKHRLEEKIIAKGKIKQGKRRQTERETTNSFHYFEWNIDFSQLNANYENCKSIKRV